MIIAIDGPAGAGKSTVARAVAEHLQFGYLDTGAMYRAVTYKAMRDRIDLSEGLALARAAAEAVVGFRDSKIYLDGEDVTAEIRLPEVGRLVSIVSRAPEVREKLVEKQREIAAELGDVVVEGRDIGNVVFPDAEVKVFLTASPRTRAERRHLELTNKGIQIDAGTVEEEINARDGIDSTRVASPLQRSADAELVDTTDRSVAEVVELIVGMARP